MPPSNGTGFTPTSLILIGLPGLETLQYWFAGPLFMLYIVILFANTSLMFIIKTVPSLHNPMYILISQLAICDVVLSSNMVPKLLAIFWLNDGEISFYACLLQLFLSPCFSAMESSILVIMAYDRYVAVCNPLRYHAILATSFLIKAASASLIRAIVSIAPLPFITMRLSFCGRYVAYTYCENMAVAKLSCSDPTANNLYLLTICVLLGAVDMSCLALSYFLIFREIFHHLSKEDRSKAINTCSSHICVMSGFYIPLFFTHVLHRIHHNNFPPYIHAILGNCFLLLPPFINPLIFGVMMKEIRLNMLQTFRKVKTQPSLYLSVLLAVRK